MEHRAYGSLGWQKRRRGRGGWQVSAAGSGEPPRKPDHGNRPPGPTRKVRDHIIAITRLLADGKTCCEAAEAAGVSASRITAYQSEYRDLWDLCLGKAVKDQVEIVRAMAGTDAVFEHPDEYVYMAEKADTWCREHDQDLFPAAHGAMTLERFYREYYAPNCMVPDVSPAYRYQFELVLKRWRLVTGDPAIEKIDTALLAKFRDFLTACRGLTPGTKMSPASVRTRLESIFRLLNKAGPPGIRNRDAADLLPRVPWIKPPRENRKAPRIVTQETLSAVFQQAEHMAIPTIPGLPAPTWWKALLVTAYNTGLRRAALFALCWDWVDLDGRRIDCPPEIIKSRREQLVPLNATCVKWLTQIRRDHERVFPWPYDQRYFDQTFHRLQYDAGVPRQEHFGLHVLRKTFATAMWKHSPQAAQLGLGHAFDQVTKDHYINGPSIVADALDKLPQPAGFG